VKEINIGCSQVIHAPLAKSKWVGQKATARMAQAKKCRNEFP
jgi:hypothetical protein